MAAPASNGILSRRWRSRDGMGGDDPAHLPAQRPRVLQREQQAVRAEPEPHSPCGAGFGKALEDGADGIDHGLVRMKEISPSASPQTKPVGTPRRSSPLEGRMCVRPASGSRRFLRVLCALPRRRSRYGRFTLRSSVLSGSDAIARADGEGGQGVSWFQHKRPQSKTRSLSGLYRPSSPKAHTLVLGSGKIV